MRKGDEYVVVSFGETANESPSRPATGNPADGRRPLCCDKNEMTLLTMRTFSKPDQIPAERTSLDPRYSMLLGAHPDIVCTEL